MITINGKTYKGNNVSVMNDQVYIDGKKVGETDDAKVINVFVEGNVQSLDIDYCDKIQISGSCDNVNSKNGNIQVIGDVTGDVTNKNGNIVCRNVGGNVNTKNGDIIHS